MYPDGFRRRLLLTIGVEHRGNLEDHVCSQSPSAGGFAREEVDHSVDDELRRRLPGVDSTGGYFSRGGAARSAIGRHTLVLLCCPVNTTLRSGRIESQFVRSQVSGRLSVVHPAVFVHTMFDSDITGLTGTSTNGWTSHCVIPTGRKIAPQRYQPRDTRRRLLGRHTT